MEDTNALDSVVISKDKVIFDLKEDTHKQCCHSYCNGVDRGGLALLKVCHNIYW